MSEPHWSQMHEPRITEALERIAAALEEQHVTPRQLQHAVAALNKRITNMEASQQQQVDAIVAELDTVHSDLDAAKTALQAEIDSLAAGNPVNLDALKTVVDQLDPAVQQLGQLKPTPPAS